MKARHGALLLGLCVSCGGASPPERGDAATPAKVPAPRQRSASASERPPTAAPETLRAEAPAQPPPEVASTLAKIVDGAFVHFTKAPASKGPHACPSDGKPEGRAGLTPPIAVDCSKGAEGHCVPGQDAKASGSYDAKVWTGNDVWAAMGVHVSDPHSFHYDYRWNNDATGFGRCQFTAQAFGDLDGDGVFSTYERAGAADESGTYASAGLYIDHAGE